MNYSESQLDKGKYWIKICFSKKSRHLLDWQNICDPSLQNNLFLKEICDILQIETKISWSSDYELIEGKTERLVGLCKSAGADAYLSGPAAKDYIVDQVFEDAGVRLEYMDYSEYPEYRQLYGTFEHGVTILDIIFNEGTNAQAFMKSFREK